ncbi:Spy/CpxP family protein refolding chaperone [Shewanella gaetbuli]|uniref:Spy/CpxP family protein refolding chaperone n=1 Tax=Shewanella gaetbuli TaxID=220752 RepID=A0A9X1ZNT3_9GAMM|nr:Spy/CpxP family protein refolding chaperone [Shewanella gaetbuli]MCL1142870.1 Spy/CpxP family protein refolding chaperone [Shewanella gaetbuli]
MKASSSFKAGLVALIASSALLVGPLHAETASSETDSGAKVEKQHEGKKHHRGHKKSSMHKMLRKLDLSDAQKAQVKTIVEKYKAQRPEKPSKEERTAHKAEMVSLLTAASFDEVTAQQMISQKQVREAEKMLQHMKMQNEIYQLLTPEQQAKFTERLEQGRTRR